MLVFSLFFALGQETDSVIVNEEEEAYEDYSNADSLLNALEYTDNTLYPKVFPKNYQEKYQSAEFDYTLTKPKESLWQKFLRKLDEIFGDIEFFKFSPEGTFDTMKGTSVVLIIVLVFLLIRYLVNRQGNLIFSKKNVTKNIVHQEIQENIHEIDFAQSIALFEEKKDFRYAVRYQFLRILKQLSDRHLIDWHPEKTNKEYITEIANSELKNDFKEWAKIFDYVWYGEFEIDEKTYREFVSKWHINP